MTAGKITIADQGLNFVTDRLQIGNSVSNEKYVGKNPFAVTTTSVNIKDSPDHPFEYGIVQNVVFDHMEMRFDPQGDLLVDSVGPFVDVWFTSPPPFIAEGAPDSANPTMLSTLFNQSTLGAMFTDTPSFPLNNVETACNHQVHLKSAAGSLAFRAGVVARDMRDPSTLIQLGSTVGTYGVKWELTVDHPGQDMQFHFTKSPLMTGDYTLAFPGPALMLGGTRAVEDSNSKLKAEKEAMKSRCESVLDPPDVTLPP